MSRDPQVYTEPDAFVPERYLKDGEYGSNVRDPEKYQFGFGRRCVMATLFRSRGTDIDRYQDLPRTSLRK